MTRWILLRGLTREARHWGDLPRRLAAGLGDSPVMAIDLPGNGTLHGERSPTSIEPMVATVRTALRSTGSDRPCVLVGMSLGAMVAMAWASAHPREIAGLVLINSSSRALSPWYRRLRWQRLATLLRILATRDVANRERLVLRLTSRHPPEPEASLLTSWSAWQHEHPVSGANAVRQLLAATRFRGPTTPLRVPTLVLVSERDALVDPACSRALAGALQAELRAHPTAGHDLALDDSVWVAGRLAEWWQAARSQT